MPIDESIEDRTDEERAEFYREAYEIAVNEVFVVRRALVGEVKSEAVAEALIEQARTEPLP